MTCTPDTALLRQAVLAADGVLHRAAQGQTAFRWQGPPHSFVLLVTGRLSVYFRSVGQPPQTPWAECRATEGQDCMPVTTAILAEREMSVRAVCTAPCTWIALPPPRLVQLVQDDGGFRRALFATHAERLQSVFDRAAAKAVRSLDCRLADWLLSRAEAGRIAATHAEIAADLLTAREVVSRRMRAFAENGWIRQGRGVISLKDRTGLRALAEGDLPACPGTMAVPRALASLDG